MSVPVNAFDALGWSHKDDPQSAFVQEKRLAQVNDLLAAAEERDALRERVAELEAQLAQLKPAPAKKAAPPKAE